MRLRSLRVAEQPQLMIIPMIDIIFFLLVASLGFVTTVKFRLGSLDFLTVTFSNTVSAVIVCFTPFT